MRELAFINPVLNYLVFRHFRRQDKEADRSRESHIPYNALAINSPEDIQEKLIKPYTEEQ